MFKGEYIKHVNRTTTYQQNNNSYKTFSIKDTMTPDSVKNETEIHTISKSIPAKDVPLGIPFSKFNWSESNKSTYSAGDSSCDPVFVIDASAVENLPTLNDSPISKNYNELPKRIPLVIQRIIKVHPEF